MISNKKAAKKLLKRAKAHPDWYSDEDVKYAKLIKKKLKKPDSSASIPEGHAVDAHIVRLEPNTVPLE